YRPVLMAGNADALHLTFTIRLRKAGGLFLADPVRPGPRPGMLPVRSLTASSDGRKVPLFFENGGTAIPIIFLPAPEYRYVQAVPVSASRDRYPAMRLHEDYRIHLLRQRVPDLNRWTGNLLRRLASQPRHSNLKSRLPEIPEGGELWLPPDQWE